MTPVGAQELLRGAIGRAPRLSLAVARLVDRGVRVAPPVRDRVLWKAMEANRGWPYPRVLDMPDLVAMRPPIVLTTAHVGSLVALGALVEQLPGDVLVLHASYPSRPKLRMRSLAGASELERAGAFRRALLTLRGGGFVLATATAAGRRRVCTDILGHRVSLSSGPFALARAADAPILPVAAYWAGPAIQMSIGAAIPPASEPEMAATFGRWLEDNLRRRPAEAEATLRYVRQSPSADLLE